MNFYDNNAKLFKEKHKIDLFSKMVDYKDFKIKKDNENLYYVGIIKEKDKWFYFDYKDTRVENFIKSINGEKKIYILIGFGLGNCIRKLLKVMGSNELIVLEDNINILNYAANVSDLSDILNDKRVNIQFCSKENLDKIFENNIKSMFFSKTVDVVTCPGYAEFNLEFINKSVECIKRMFNNTIVNKNTLELISDDILKALFNNLPYIVKNNSSSKLRGLFEGKTAVVVSSGPSLSKNIHFLKKYMDKVVIITGSRNLDYMEKEGIKPNLVCIIDSWDVVYEFTKNSFDKDLFFVSTEHANTKTIEKLGQKNMFCTVLFNEFINKITKNKFDKFPSIGSVAHLCTIMAVYLGCKNVVFIGQDLAFTDNKMHDDFSGSRSGANEVSGRNDLFYVEGNYEKKVLSDLSFQNFKEWFEKYIQENKEIKFINCTEGGAKIKGTEIARLDETLNKLCSENIEANDKLKEAFNLENLFDKYRIIHEVMKVEEEIEIIKANYEKGIMLCDKIYEFNNGNMKIDINKVVAEFSKIDEVSAGKDYINSLINIISLVPLKKILNDKALIENSNDTPKEKGRKYAKRNKAVCTLYVESMNTILKLIREGIEELKKL